MLSEEECKTHPLGHLLLGLFLFNLFRLLALSASDELFQLLVGYLFTLCRELCPSAG